MTEIILPDEIEWSLDAVVKAYIGWLEVKSRGHMKTFIQRLDDDPEAAYAEAVTFNLLRMSGRRPRPGEALDDKGGVDFICDEKAPHIAIEVTVLHKNAVTAASGLQSPMQSGGAIGFSQITSKLMYESVNKAKQMAGYQMARVLVLATTHEGAGLLMGAHAAEELLTGTTAFRVRIGDTDAKPEVFAALKNSVFFREKDGTVEPARQSISAILLMGIHQDRASVIGVLHPEPAVPLDPSLLERVHFVRLRHWPIKERFGIEWIGPAPSPTTYVHMPKGLDDEDLKSG